MHSDYCSGQILLNVREIANLLRLAPGTIYHMVSQKRIPGVVRLSRRCLRFWNTFRR